MEKTCTVEGCSKRLVARGMCHAHYRRAWKAGMPVRNRATPGETAKVLERIVAMDTQDCIPWPLLRNRGGYGTMTFRNKTTLVSRVVCILVHGEPPTDRHEAAHSCGNGHLACSNKQHLRWATPEENEADKLVNGRVRKADAHWKTELTADDVRAIMRDPRGSKLLAKEYPVTDRQIRHIRKGGSWNSVTGLPPIPRPPSKQTKAQREAPSA